MKIPKIRQAPSGVWYCQLRLQGQSVYISDPDKDTVEAKAYAYKAGILKAKRQPEDITLETACNREIDRLRSRLSPSTIEGYEKIVRLRFQPLMKTRLSKITPRKIEQALSDEYAVRTTAGEKISPKTVKNAYAFISQVLKNYDCDIGRHSLAEIKRNVPTIIPPEVLLPALKGTNIELPCLLAVWLSLSMSEIRGLTKSKSIQNGQLRVVETVVTVGGKDVRKKGGKEEERSRVLNLPPYLAELIDKVEGDVIVPESGSVIYKRFSRLLEKNGLPHMSFHQLRHLSASIMAMLDIPEKYAQERGGWKTPHTMKSVYMHTFTEQRIQADEKVDAYMENIIASKNASNNEKSQE